MFVARNLYAVMILLLAIVSVQGFADIQLKGKLVHVSTEGEGAIARLQELDLDIWEIEDGKALVYLIGDQEALLEDEGVKYEALPDGHIGRNLKEALSLKAAADDGAFHTYEELVADMQSLVAANPGICSLTSYGQSLEGRELWFLKISDNVGVDEDEAEVLFIHNQHAREWASVEVGWGIAHHFIDNYSTNPTVTDLVDNSEIFLFICANPDGKVYSSLHDRMWRNNRRGTSGVDLNRNFPTVSGYAAPAAPSQQAPAAAFSEPPTQAVRDFIDDHNVLAVINFHAYGQKIMYPWAYTYLDPPNPEFYEEICNGYRNALEAVPGSETYSVGQWSDSLNYTGTGVTDDWLVHYKGVPCITIELRPSTSGEGGFVLQESDIAPMINENLAGVEFFIDWARNKHEDATAPVISNFMITNISDDFVTMTWDTDDYTNARINYGLTAAHGSQSDLDMLFDDSHRLVVTGLMPETEYHFQASSTNLAGLVGYSSGLQATTTAVVVASHEVIIDNADPEFNTTGTWTTSVNVSGYYATNYQWHSADASGEVAIWDAVVSVPGYYDVYTRYSSAGDRAPDARFTTSHSSGNSDTYINQSVNGGTWVSLGHFYFNAGTARVTLNTDASSGVVIADAIRFYMDLTAVEHWDELE